MNSARDLLRSYMDILSEAPVPPQPTPKASLAQTPAAGAERPTGPAPSPNTKPNGPSQSPTSAAQTPAEPQYSPQVANPQKVGTTQYGSGPAAQQQEPRSYGPGAATGSWGTTVDGPGGSSTKVDPSTGEKTVGDESGSVKTDASGTPISYSVPSLGGHSQTTYTGSAGKGPASGAQTRGFNSGDVSVSQELDPSGKQTSQDTSYTMGATTINSKQGAAGTPTTYSATVDKRAFDNDQDMAAAQGEADKFAQQLQSGQGQPVQEEDDHEHPESARHLLKKLLKLLKDEKPIEEGGAAPGSDPRETVNAFKKYKEQEGKSGVTKDNPSQYPTKTDIPKRDLPKNSSAVIGKEEDSEEKVAESLNNLLKAIKEGRIQ